MGGECRDCAAGLEHCHGTVIHHADFGVECTEPDCATPEVVHALTVDCDTLGCACGTVTSAHRVG